MHQNLKVAKLPLLDHYRTDAAAIVDDAVNILNMVVSQWKSIILPLLDSSRSDLMKPITISESQEISYDRY